MIDWRSVIMVIQPGEFVGNFQLILFVILTHFLPFSGLPCITIITQISLLYGLRCTYIRNFVLWYDYHLDLESLSAFFLIWAYRSKYKLIRF